MIVVLFFAQLKEQLQTARISLEIKTPCTVAHVQTALHEQNPAWAQYLKNRTLLSAVNQDMGQSDCIVNETDEVAFFPPVTGG